MIGKIHKTVIVFAAALMCPFVLSAQPVGTVRGTVTDAASGEALPYVNVVVMNTSPAVGTTTGNEGCFRNFCRNNLSLTICSYICALECRLK